MNAAFAPKTFEKTIHATLTIVSLVALALYVANLYATQVVAKSNQVRESYSTFFVQHNTYATRFCHTLQFNAAFMTSHAHSYKVT